jgi:hypothetical protein
MFGFVIPFFIGIMLDLYILMPMRSHHDVIEIYLTVDWTIGVIGFSIFYGLVCFLPNNNAFKQQLVRLNWRNFDELDVWYTTTDVIVPVIAYLVAAIILPYLVILAITSIYCKFIIIDPTETNFTA